MPEDSEGVRKIVSELQLGESTSLGNMLIVIVNERSENGTSFGYSASKLGLDSTHGDTRIFLVTTRNLD